MSMRDVPKSSPSRTSPKLKCTKDRIDLGIIRHRPKSDCNEQTIRVENTAKLHDTDQSI